MSEIRLTRRSSDSMLKRFPDALRGVVESYLAHIEDPGNKDKDLALRGRMLGALTVLQIYDEQVVEESLNQRCLLDGAQIIPVDCPSCGGKGFPGAGCGICGSPRYRITTTAPANDTSERQGKT